MTNTKKNGQIRILLFQEADGDYCAVCLDFDLIEWGKDKEKLMLSIQEAAQSYLNGIIDENLPDELLNRPAPAKYWTMLEKQKQSFLIKPNNNVRKLHSRKFFGFESNPYDGSFVFA